MPIPEIRLIPVQSPAQTPKDSATPFPEPDRPSKIEPSQSPIADERRHDERRHDERRHDERRQLVQEFLDSNDFAANSRKVYQRELQRFLEWTDQPWEDLTSRHLSFYKAYLVEEVKTPQGRSLSKSSINAAITTLKSFFSWLVLTYPDRRITNPMVGIKLEKLPLPVVKSLTTDQMKRVWAALDGLGETQMRDRVLVHLLSHGLRAGEVVALNVDAIEGPLVRLMDTKTGKPRLVPLRQESQTQIGEYLQMRSRSGEALTSDRPLILSHHHGRVGDRLTYHGLHFSIERIGQLANVPDLHPHQFRHTYATDLLLKGMDPAHARQLTGHQSEEGLRRYTLRSEQEAAIQAFYRIMGEDPHPM